MAAITALILQFLPQASSWIGVLQYIPAAATTVQELIDFVNRTIAILKSPEVLMTPAQEAALDDFIDNDWKTHDYWKTDDQQMQVPPSVTPPPTP